MDPRQLFESLEITNCSSDSVKTEFEQVRQLLESDGLYDKREKWITYEYMGINVPRVTSIINDTINKEYLNKWAAKLGDKYDKELSRILDTGSLVHSYIEGYITYGKLITDIGGFENADPIQTMKAYHNFVKFWKDMKDRGYKFETLGLEVPFSTPWYGGTIDYIAAITFPNGMTKNYILDFKTSNKITYNYFLQLILYKYAVKLNSQFPPINGIGIIRVDKTSDKYEYLFLDDSNEVDVEFMRLLEESAISMLNWYYRMNSIDSYYKDFKRYYVERGGWQHP